MTTFFQHRGLFYLQVLLVLAAGFWTFSPALLGDFLWDDTVYLSQNAIIQSPDGWWKIWFEPGHAIEYYPITSTVQWLQWHAWHNLTFGYHLTNILLHLISAFLVWRLLAKLGLHFAFLGGLIFALHPTAVESVTWISELKNTLSLPPFLLAMIAWIDFEEHGRRRDYLFTLGLFLVAMLCKASFVMFPLVTLLYAWWKRERVTWSDLRHSAPFWVISVAFGIITIAISNRYVQLHGLSDDVPLGGPLSRMACAGLSLSFYLWKCLWPTGLLPIYPQWNVTPPSLFQFLPWPVFAGLFFWLWKRRASWGRHALLGFGFFALNLALFLGFRGISYMSFTWVMDHYLYLPIIGLIGLVVAGLSCANDKLPRLFRFGLMALIGVALIAMAKLSHDYAGNYQDGSTFWTYTLDHNPQAWPAYNNLGNALLEQGRAKEAAGCFQKVLQLHPGSPLAHNNLGVALEQLGQKEQALNEYREAARLAPSYLDAQGNLARLGKIQR